MTPRPNDLERVSCLMLMRLAAASMDKTERFALAARARGAWRDRSVPWGHMKLAVEDTLKIINHRRQRDGRQLMDNDELRRALQVFLEGKRKDPLAEELGDALCNLREQRQGINKFPLLENLRQIA